MWGLYKIVYGGQTNRFKVAKELLVVFGLRDSVRLNQIDSEYFKEKCFANRPASERLTNREPILRSLSIMQDWRASIPQYIDSRYRC